MDELRSRSDLFATVSDHYVQGVLVLCFQLVEYCFLIALDEFQLCREAWLSAIIKDANDGVESEIPKVKDAVLRSIAKFAALSSGKLDTLLKAELKLREDIALMGQEATDAHAEAAVQTYKARGDDFYDELTITDN